MTNDEFSEKADHTSTLHFAQQPTKPNIRCQISTRFTSVQHKCDIFLFPQFPQKAEKIAFGMLVPTKLLGPCFAKSLNTPTWCPVRVNKTIQGCHPRPPCSMAPNMHHVPCFTETWPRAPDCPFAFRYWIHYCSNSINWRHDPSQQKANEKIATYIVIKMQLI